MSFEKAEQLLRLATLLAGRRVGMTIDEVVEEFGGSRRTAQRMLRALERSFPDLQYEDDDDRRRRWRLPRSGLGDLLAVRPEELAALNFAMESLSQSGQEKEHVLLEDLKAKVLALVPPNQALRLEPDYEALLEGQGLAFRPGPRAIGDLGVAAVIGEAIKGGCCVEVLYRARSSSRAKWATLGPLGILVGARRYLVAISPDEAAGSARLYRLEAIRKARPSEQVFERPADFEMHRFARRSFGSFHRSEEYGPVVWKFTPKAAAHARSFQFHPDQVQEPQPDGSLIVRFEASGHLEMCWYLYAWGDQVEVLEPKALRDMCRKHQRSDFPALP